MNRLRQLLVAVLMAIWTGISVLIAGSIYAVLGGIFGRHFWQLEHSLGRFTINITTTDGVDIVPFPFLIIFLFLVVLNFPVVGLIARHRKRKDPEQPPVG